MAYGLLDFANSKAPDFFLYLGLGSCARCPDARERAGPVFPPPPHVMGVNILVGVMGKAIARKGDLSSV